MSSRGADASKREQSQSLTLSHRVGALRSSGAVCVGRRARRGCSAARQAALEQPGQQGADRRLHAQNAFAQLHRLQSGGGKFLHLVGESSRLPDRSRVTGPRPRVGRPGNRRDDRPARRYLPRAAADGPRQGEAFFDDDLGQHGIARLFEAEDQLFTDGGRFEEGRLPEALFTR